MIEFRLETSRVGAYKISEYSYTIKCVSANFWGEEEEEEEEEK